MTNHPITPPPELVLQWEAEHFRNCGWVDASGDTSGIRKAIAAAAAQWGADWELEACCAQISQCHLLTAEQRITIAEYLHYCRRPKPPSLKEQALEALKDIECEYVIGATTSTIRQALEALPND
jgi:predicted secreted Zn-dependent protease